MNHRQSLKELKERFCLNTGMEVTGQELTNMSTIENEQMVFNVYDDPVMRNAVDVLEKIGKFKKVILRAKGNSIPNAVAIANIITEKMLKGSTDISKITVDSEYPKGVSKMLSTIEIIITKRI